MANTRTSQLTLAMRKKHFVRMSSRFEQGSIRGYILDVGPSFFLLALVGESVRFNGFECLRSSAARNVRPDPYAAFAETALKKRGERKPKKPSVSVASIEELLLSAGRAFPLVTIHRERVNPDVCWIGRILRVNRGRVSLLEIGPDAKWDETPTEYRVSEITRVAFDGDYEKALHLVGGDPPTS